MIILAKKIKAINRKRVKVLKKRKQIKGDYVAIDKLHKEIKRTKGFESWSVGHTGGGG
jgi:type IV secretory pathway protease TraF